MTSDRSRSSTLGATSTETPRTAAALRVRSGPVVVVLGGDGNEVGRVSGAFPRRSLRRLVAVALAQSA